MKKLKERIFFVIIFAFAGMIFVFCGKEQSETSKKGIAHEEGDTLESPGIADGTGPEIEQDKKSNPENDTAPEIEPDTTPLSIRDISSVELVKEFNIGWNLGNTLDATGGGALINTETSWGNPKTTEEVFKSIKEAGFDIVRIPVSWGNHLGPEPDYKIHAMWLDRVNEVVDDAIENELYVILNMHHEEWHFPSYDNLEKASTILTLVWKQIAERFKEYDEHLIFEGMNEPRMKGTPQEWTGGNTEARDVINQLNHAFVETIRDSGGNNTYRHLMIPTYAASSDTKTWKDFIIPEDDKIIISIHAYTPYNFALNKNGTSEWNPDNTKDTIEIDNLMKNLDNFFVSKGYPVIIGEFGAMNKENDEARAMWAKYYIQKAAEKGIPCIWWDNGAFTGGGELFGLLDRRTGTWYYQEVLEALMSGLE